MFVGKSPKSAAYNVHKSIRLLPALGLIASLTACEAPYALRVSSMSGDDSSNVTGDKGIALPVEVPGAKPPANPAPKPSPSVSPSPKPTVVMKDDKNDHDNDDDDYSWTNTYTDGKLACDRLKRQSDPAIVMGDKAVDTTRATNLTLEGKGGIVIAEAERILSIADVQGKIEVNARTIGPIRGLHGQIDINAVSIESIAAIHGNGRFVADRLSTAAETFGNLKLNVGAITMIQGVHGHTAVIARKNASSKQSTIQLVEGTDGHVLICGMHVQSLRNTRGHVVVVGGDVDEVSDVKGKVIVIGGKINKSSNVDSERIEVR